MFSFIISFALSLCFVLTPFAHAKGISEVQKALETVAKELNPESTVKDVLLAIEKKDKLKSEQFKEVLLRNRISEDTKIPKVELSGGVLSIKNSYSIREGANGLLRVSHKDRDLVISPAIGAKELLEKFETFSISKTSWMNFFINEAYAEPFTIIGYFIAALLVLWIASMIPVTIREAIDLAIIDLMDQQKKLCDSLKVENPHSKAELVAKYNELADFGREKCSVIFHTSFREHGCQSLGVVKSCFRELIEKQPSINDTDRGLLREVTYDKKKDKYIMRSSKQ